jgi:hypothetical protein
MVVNMASKQPTITVRADLKQPTSRFIQPINLDTRSRAVNTRPRSGSITRPASGNKRGGVNIRNVATFT